MTLTLDVDQVTSIVRKDLIATRDSMQASLNWRMEGDGPVTYCLDRNEDCKAMKQVIRALNTVIEYCYYVEEKNR